MRPSAELGFKSAEALRAKQIRQAPDDQYIDARSQPEPEAQIVAEIDEVSARILRKTQEVAEKLDDPGVRSTVARQSGEHG